VKLKMKMKLEILERETTPNDSLEIPLQLACKISLISILP
jgi:hypothetical protein